MRAVFSTFFVCVFIAATASAQPVVQAKAPASGPAIAAGGNLTYASAYVWRGFEEHNKPVLQPSAWVSVGPVAVESWMSVETDGSDLRLAEHDISLTYTYETERASFTAGFLNYLFSDNPGDDFEAHNELTASVTGNVLLSPTIEFFKNVSSGGGAYASATVSYPYEVAPGATISAEAALGYNHKIWVAESGFSDARGTVKFSYEHPNKHVGVDVSLDFVKGFMDELVDHKWVAAVALSIK
jgi:hypothetical protein